MDRLEDIKARCNAAKSQKEKGDSITAACIAWSIVINDIPYLLSEVGRLNALHKREIIVTGEYAQRVIDLTARAEKAEANASRLINQAEEYKQKFNSALARAEKAEAERDTYKAALEALHISTDLLKGE